MAYDQALADRIRNAVRGRAGITEKEMFGGIAFLLDEKMFVGIVKDDLMVRVGPEAHAAALEEPHVRPMDFTGRPMKGYLYVALEGTRTQASVTAWVERAATFVVTVVKKPPKRPKRPRARGNRG